jgi:hypothetical protein
VPLCSIFASLIFVVFVPSHLRTVALSSLIRVPAVHCGWRYMCLPRGIVEGGLFERSLFVRDVSILMLDDTTNLFSSPFSHLFQLLPGLKGS